MDFTFKEEQQQFADALRRWIARDYGFDVRQRIVHSATGVSDVAWDTLVELGMTALPVPEEQGGFSGSAVDMLVVMQELGRGLVVEPYWATVVGAQFLKLAGGKEVLLERIANGQLKLSCALTEKHSRHDLNDVTTMATVNGEGYLIDGTRPSSSTAARPARSSWRRAAAAPSAIATVSRCLSCRPTPTA